MPVYEYECHACGHHFSEHQTIREHDEAHLRCPKCGGDNVEQRIEASYVKAAKKS
jgi:putative FmdB family regulatory protein